MAKTCVIVAIACLHPVSMPPSCLLSGQLLLRVVIRSNSPPSCDESCSGIHPCGEFRLITSPHFQQLHIVCRCYQTARTFPILVSPFSCYPPRLFIPRRIFGAITLRVCTAFYLVSLANPQRSNYSPSRGNGSAMLNVTAVVITSIMGSCHLHGQSVWSIEFQIQN
ncbi:hypothetical protein L210DRAFT_3535975 [Boletus edulis BED1]|uniref:Uncharacterized protein n=1 Tax=Boletus edulis BED1 TaxID=1328754 RepID=A0AAD4GG93_BOLED|nr:hypothetical protein L210DRAFT_3535975 [Boletus edulis BED1]